MPTPAALKELCGAPPARVGLAITFSQAFKKGLWSRRALRAGVRDPDRLAVEWMGQARPWLAGGSAGGPHGTRQPTKDTREALTAQGKGDTLFCPGLKRQWRKITCLAEQAYF